VTHYYKNITSSIGANARIQRDIQLWTVQKALTSHKRKTREPSGTWKDKASDGLPIIHASLRISYQQPGESTSSKLRDPDMRIQGSQNSPTSGVANAKWLAGINTCISINPSYKHALKIVSWAYAYRSRYRDSKWYQEGNMHCII